MSRVAHIVVAAGSGSRFGSDVPKQYCLLSGRPVVMHAIDALRRAVPGSDVVLVISREMESFWHELCREHGFASPAIAYGGATRWHSVKNGLAMLPPDCSVVTVHDGARPLVPAEVVRAAVEAVDSGADGAVPAVAVTDSLRHIAPGSDGPGRAVTRSEYVAVQTPQAFRRSLLEQAYAAEFRPEFTDDASVMESAGFGDLRITPGSPVTIKITNPDDLAVAELLASRMAVKR